ncbi:MAG: rRNA maturation RNase YbeY [Bacteroidales bacterium]|nr:rRNA maturation RNase YbeY [Bacteroidales bacterium]
MSLRIFYDSVKPEIKKRRNLIKFINKVIREEGRIPGDLNFIFTDDNSLLEINKEFLQHNYFTDVITFSENSERILNGEVYMSIDRIRENAEKYKTEIKEEILRVVIHGVLHLCGYDDKSANEKIKMRWLENKYLKMFKVEKYEF